MIDYFLGYYLMVLYYIYVIVICIMLVFLKYCSYNFFFVRIIFYCWLNVWIGCEVMGYF